MFEGVLRVKSSENTLKHPQNTLKTPQNTLKPDVKNLSNLRIGGGRGGEGSEKSQKIS